MLTVTAPLADIPDVLSCLLGEIHVHVEDYPGATLTVRRTPDWEWVARLESTKAAPSVLVSDSRVKIVKALPGWFGDLLGVHFDHTLASNLTPLAVQRC